jgi:hypothetical protein
MDQDLSNSESSVNGGQVDRASGDWHERGRRVERGRGMEQTVARCSSCFFPHTNAFIFHVHIHTPSNRFSALRFESKCSDIVSDSQCRVCLHFPPNLCFSTFQSGSDVLGRHIHSQQTRKHFTGA